MSAPFTAIMRPRSALLPSLHWCKLASDFYPTVKAALRHESVDSEEDRKGLGCHFGTEPVSGSAPTSERIFEFNS